MTKLESHENRGSKLVLDKFATLVDTAARQAIMALTHVGVGAVGRFKDQPRGRRTGAGRTRNPFDPARPLPTALLTAGPRTKETGQMSGKRLTEGRQTGDEKAPLELGRNQRRGAAEQVLTTGE